MTTMETRRRGGLLGQILVSDNHPASPPTHARARLVWLQCRWKSNEQCLVSPEVVTSLPPSWESEKEAAALPLEAKRYAELVERLQELSTRKEEAEMRVKRLRLMKAQLEPFKIEDSAATDGSSFAAVNGIQENLVQRGGELEKELERMRMLLVRVGDKVARLKEREGSDDDLFGDRDADAMMVDDVEVDERGKVEAMMGRMG